MNKESKLNLNAGNYAIHHCILDQTYNGLEVHKMLCDAYIAGNNDTLEDNDERIKNSLINLIKMSSEVGGFALHKWEADEMLAWLENQGEKHPDPYNGISFEYNGHIWGMCARDNGVDILFNKKLIQHISGENEQKSTWSEEDKDIIEEVVSYLINYSNIVSKEDVDRIEYLIDKIQDICLQQKQEWSEEDERLCQCLIEDQEEALDKVRNNMYGHSEIISDLKEMYRERIDWLKSLRPLNRWKPSDEQMEALDWQVENTSVSSWQYKATKELLEDLKKLKEE